MTDLAPHVRPLSDASSGEAPGRARLQGRRVLIVGGGQRTFDPATDPIGNGRAMSLLCAREGAQVAVADLNLESAEDTAARIRGEGGRAVAIQADIRMEADVVRMIQEARAAMGGLDGLVVNVGAFGGLGLRGFDLEEWDRIQEINLRGPMLCAREALDVMADDSSIIFISSVAAFGSGSQLVAYDTSKAAISALMRHVAREGTRRGIRANTVVPGLVDTPNGRIAGAGRPERGKAALPFGRQATGWEIAYAVLFFLSEESVYVTAQHLAVDCGISGL